MRAGTAGRDPAHRDSYDWATRGRSGKLPVVIELCAPFLRRAACSSRSAAATLTATLLARGASVQGAAALVARADRAGT